MMKTQKSRMRNIFFPALSVLMPLAVFGGVVSADHRSHGSPLLPISSPDVGAALPPPLLDVPGGASGLRLDIDFIPNENAAFATAFGKRGDRLKDRGAARRENRDRRGDGFGKEDEGNEVTGQIAAWLFVAANLTVAVSLLAKASIHVFSPRPETRAAIQKWNGRQKRLLMRFHYGLNPAAFFMGVIHFSLSGCRSSPLPEWGLILAGTTVFLGLAVRFRGTPKKVKPILMRLHSRPEAISLIAILLVVGHMMVD
jgi:hypothetical protein